MNIRLSALSCVTYLMFALVGVSAQEFSASVVLTGASDQSKTGLGRVLVADGKVHLELPDFRDGYFLVDPATVTAYYVSTTRRVFMEARQSSRVAQVLVPVDPDHPCEQWQAVAVIVGIGDPQHHWRCDRAGEELVGTRRAIRYQAVASDERQYDVWIDPEIRFPIKIRAEVDAMVEITNIEQGPQPSAAFQVPPGFGKFDPQGLIDRIKQSDVWVETPRPQENATAR
jgi:hypothetical protein